VFNQEYLQLKKSFVVFNQYLVILKNSCGIELKLFIT